MLGDFLNGRDLRDLPLVERKKRLRKLIEKSKSPYIICAQHVRGKGTARYREICKRDLEGIVAKRKDAPYTSTAQWLKCAEKAKKLPTRFRDKFRCGRDTGNIVLICDRCGAKAGVFW